MKLFSSAAVSVVLAVMGLLGVGTTESRAAHAGNPADFPARLPDFTLADPDGKNFTPKRSGGNVTVIVVTEPNMSQGGVQKNWVSQLGNLPSSVNFYLLENMKGQMFQSIALNDMKSDYKEGTRPVLLIDMQGAAAGLLQAPRGKTVVYVFNGNNRLVHVQIGHATAAAVQNVNNAVSSSL